MIKKIILLIILIALKHLDAQDAQCTTNKACAEVQQAHFFLFIDTQTNADSYGIAILSDKEAKEINSLFGTSDILFIPVIITDTPAMYCQPARGETQNLERHGDLKIQIKPKQIPRYFPFNVFFNEKHFKKEGDIIILIKNVTLYNGQQKTIEFRFTLNQKHGLSRKKRKINSLLREYLDRLLKKRCIAIKEACQSESPIFGPEIPLTTILEEYEFGPLPSKEVLRLIKSENKIENEK